MVLWLYDALSVIYLALAAPAYLFRMVTRQKSAGGFSERFGRISPETLKSLQGRPVCWIHAVSVGEVHCAADLIRKFKAARPDTALVVSTVTDTGRKRAQALQAADVVLYLPLDLTPIVRRVLSRIRPAVFVVVETELWPRLLTELHRSRCRILLVNGRISDRSFRHYRKTRWFWKDILATFDRFAMQTPSDADRIQQIGAPADRVTVTGNMKFDMEPTRPTPDDEQSLCQWLQLSENQTLLAAGSTHPGEEELLLRVFSRLHVAHPGLRLLLAPRHIHRADTIEKQIQQAGFVCRRRSREQPDPQQSNFSPVFLLDTMGELNNLYSMCKIAFIGKSLLGWGGQNPIEAALYEKPVLFGPHMENFRQAARILLEAQGAVCIPDEKALESALSAWLHDPDAARATGLRAAKAVRNEQGATQKNLALLLDQKHNEKP